LPAEPQQRPTGLVVQDLSKRFGGHLAVDRCSLRADPGSIVGLIGPNGSGKSTLFNLITNLVAPDAGRVTYDGRSLAGLKLHEVARRGIARTFQEVKIFRELSAWENLRLAALGRSVEGWHARGRALFAELGLAELHDADGEQLSIGQQRLLELAMQLVVEPSALLLDEPLAGVHPNVRSKIAAMIRSERDKGKVILIIEHDFRFMMRLCDRLVVLDHGVKIAEGPPAAVRSDPRVLAALLGSRKADTRWFAP
jgi:ABC-type branched-subunit amino acid transport system ATPase component